MSKPVVVLAAIAGAAAMTMSGAHAATQSDFAAAYNAATAAEQQAGALRNQWTPTEEALKGAKKAAAAKDYDQAVTLARHAEALAKASIAQATEQDKLWPDAVIK